MRPRQNRNRGHRILRTALDQTVAVDQINQGIALLVEKTHHLHGLEHQGRALLEHLFTILELTLEADRPDLATSDGRLRPILSQSQPTLYTTRLGARQVASHA